MQIKEADIFQFGKLQNKNISFEPGTNVIYGKNEAGKSTLHSFLCAMLFGMEKGRGRSSVTDAYSQYEPWHAPSFYAGALKFTVGQQKFYLERNFYSKEKTDYLRNELDGEELSVGFGDLTMLLGGVSKDSLSLIHISEPTRRTPISYAVFCLKKKKQNNDIFTQHSLKQI